MASVHPDGRRIVFTAGSPLRGGLDASEGGRSDRKRSVEGRFSQLPFTPSSARYPRPQTEIFQVAKSGRVSTKLLLSSIRRDTSATVVGPSSWPTTDDGEWQTPKPAKGEERRPDAMVCAHGRSTRANRCECPGAPRQPRPHAVLSDDLLKGRRLKHFQFGPLEWLWRTLTYMRLQPIRRPPTGALAVGS